MIGDGLEADEQVELGDEGLVGGGVVRADEVGLEAGRQPTLDVMVQQPLGIRGLGPVVRAEAEVGRAVGGELDRVRGRGRGFRVRGNGGMGMGASGGGRRGVEVTLDEGQGGRRSMGGMVGDRRMRMVG